MNVNGRTALITGATSGVGLALTRELIGRGCKVIAVGRSASGLAAVGREFPGAILLKCDLSQERDVKQLVEHIHQSGERISILINNAAIQCQPLMTSPDFSFETIEKEVSTNFTSVVWTVAHCLPAMLDMEDAAIVNISSGLAIFPKTSSAVYCATKAAVHSFSQSLRYQLENTKVQVIEVLLPLVETAMSAGRGSGKISPEDAARAIAEAIARDIQERYVGKAALLPILARVMPSLARRILKNSNA